LLLLLLLPLPLLLSLLLSLLLLLPLPLLLPLLLPLPLLFSCHPSPKAEDLLLLLPILVFAVACSFSLVIPQRSGGICCCRCLCF
jgi:hypothetical protein